MKTKTIFTTLAILSIASSVARADPKLQIEGLGEFPRANQAIVRTTAIAQLPGNIEAFAFSDFYGRTTGAFCSEASMGKKLVDDIGAKLEWNGGTGMMDIFRFGPNYSHNLNDRTFLDLKLYPLTVGSDGKIQRASQFSLFGRLDLPRDFYVEDWTDINLDYKDKTPRRVNVQSETTFGKKVLGSLSVEAQGAYNVNVLDRLEARAGLRYEF